MRQFTQRSNSVHVWKHTSCDRQKPPAGSCDCCNLPRTLDRQKHRVVILTEWFEKRLKIRMAPRLLNRPQDAGFPIMQGFAFSPEEDDTRNGVMNKARKTIVVVMLGVSMLTCLSGCVNTGCQATHPFSTMFQGHDPLALNSSQPLPEVAGDVQQTAATEKSQDQIPL